MYNFFTKTNSTLYTFLLIVLFIGLTSNVWSNQEETIDDQVTSIANLLMCPVCQGQSVGESNSNLAHDMRDIVRKQLEQGKSKEEILAYFVNSYGETILASPPPKGINWLLWLLPGVAIIVGGVGITMFLFRAQKEDKGEQHDEINAQQQVDDEYIKRVSEELNENDT